MFSSSASDNFDPFLTKRCSVMCFVPLSERCSVDNNDSVFNKSLCSYQFVVTGIVSNINDPSFPGNRFRAPREISSIKTKCSILFVASTASYSVNSLLSKLGHGSWSSKFELTLVSNWGTFTSGRPAFMQMIACYTHVALMEVLVRSSFYDENSGAPC